MQLTVELGSVVSSVRFAERQALCAGDVYDPFVLSFPRGSEPDPSTLSVRLFDGPPDATLSNELASVSGFGAVPGHRRLLRAAWTLSTPELRALFDRVQTSDSDGPLDSYPPRSAWLVVSQPGAVFASCEVPLVLRSLVPAVNTASGITAGERAKLAALPDDAVPSSALAAAVERVSALESVSGSAARGIADALSRIAALEAAVVSDSDDALGDLFRRIAEAEGRLDAGSDADAGFAGRLDALEGVSPRHVTAEDVMRGWTEWVCDPPAADGAFSVRWQGEPPGWELLLARADPATGAYGPPVRDGFVPAASADGGPDASDISFTSASSGSIVRAVRVRVLPAALADHAGVVDRISTLEGLQRSSASRIRALESDGDQAARRSVAALAARVSALESVSDSDGASIRALLAGYSRLATAVSETGRTLTGVQTRVSALESDGDQAARRSVAALEGRVAALESDSDVEALEGRVAALEAAEAGAQADWSESDPASPSYVRNRPDVSLLLTRAEAEDGWTAWSAPSGAPSGATVEFDPVKGSWYLSLGGSRISGYAGGPASAALTFTYTVGRDERTVAYSRKLIRPTRMSQLVNDAGYVTTFDAAAGSLLATAVAPAWEESDCYSVGDVVSSGGRLWRRTSAAWTGTSPQAGTGDWSETDVAAALAKRGLATEAYVEERVMSREDVGRIVAETDIMWTVAGWDAIVGGEETPSALTFVDGPYAEVALGGVVALHASWGEGETGDDLTFGVDAMASDSDGGFTAQVSTGSITATLKGRVRNAHGLARLEDLEGLGADRTSQLENDGSDGEHPYATRAELARVEYAETELTVPVAFKELDAGISFTGPGAGTVDGRQGVLWSHGADWIFYDAASGAFSSHIEGIEDETFTDTLADACDAAVSGIDLVLTKTAVHSVAQYAVDGAAGTTVVNVPDPVARKSDLASLDAGAIKSGTLDPARLPVRSFTFGKAANFSHFDSFSLLFDIVDSVGREFSVTNLNVDSTNLSFSGVAFVTIRGWGGATDDSVDIIAIVDGVERTFYVAYNRTVTLTANSSILLKAISGTEFNGCLVTGTMVLMADGSWRRIEDIGYDDTLLTWDREAGRTVAVRPSWIMRPYEATHWYECRFASGRTLCTTGAPFDPGHRVYSLDTGRYEYERDAIGHRVLSVTPFGGIGAETRYEPGEDVLESVACVPHRCTACNIITEGRYSLIAEGVLTSCRLSNPGMTEDEIAAYWARLERSRKPREV